MIQERMGFGLKKPWIWSFQWTDGNFFFSESFHCGFDENFGWRQPKEWMFTQKIEQHRKHVIQITKCAVKWTLSLLHRFPCIKENWDVGCGDVYIKIKLSFQWCFSRLCYYYVLYCIVPRCSATFSTHAEIIPVGQFFRQWNLHSRSFRLIDWLIDDKLTLIWLVYWIRTAWSVFTGAELKWVNITGWYSK